VDDDEIQVNCGRCGKSIIVRPADILDKRLVYCAHCERMVQPREWPRLVRDKDRDKDPDA
jgi:DNA-directed RNA polymerase subunit RPC12/RpoP